MTECDPRHLWRSAWFTFLSFVIAGLIPLIPFFFTLHNNLALTTSAVFTGIGLFVIGALRSHYTNRGVLVSGFEVFAVGGIAAALAYFVGLFIRSIIG